ncbi:P52 family lipoprotein [Borreliella bavariensis]|uniref:P52 family lipoprotein n=1 Tax=Borreliella bavariensis TaxID=664662 RepID=UPI001C004CD7|nr:P52 family lipoprotein [Borreliella bavariensis]
MSRDDFFTIKGTLSNLKLSAVEYCVLGDMRRIIDHLQNNNFLAYQPDDSNSLADQSDGSNFLWPLFEDYDENDFDEFFTKLGPNRAKELINLFCKLKIRVSNSVFETEVFFLYLCIKDTCLVNLLYFDDDEHNFFDDDNEQNCFDLDTPTLSEFYRKIKRSLEIKLKDFSVKQF